jgi:hypothetical protein
MRVRGRPQALDVPVLYLPEQRPAVRPQRIKKAQHTPRVCLRRRSDHTNRITAGSARANRLEPAAGTAEAGPYTSGDSVDLNVRARYKERT